MDQSTAAINPLNVETGTSCSHPVDIFRTLDGEFGQPGDVQLSAAIGIHLDVQLIIETVAQQIPDQHMNILVTARNNGDVSHQPRGHRSYADEV